MTQVQIDDLRKNPETGVLERWNGQYWERVDDVSNLPSKKNSIIKKVKQPISPIGSAENPYPIKNGEDLQNIATGKRDAYYVLMNDIDLSGYDNWNPIPQSILFRGVLDGAGHKITGLKCRNVNNMGLFKINYGTIKNLIIEDATLISEGDEYVSSAGIIAASNSGSIIDCKISGTVTGSIIEMAGVVGKNRNRGTISNVVFIGSLSGETHWVGGIAGYSFGNISNSSSSVTFSGKARWAGGIVGYNSNVIESCTSKVTISGESGYVGGIVGKNKGTIFNSSTSGSISCKSHNINGVAGYNSKVIDNCTSNIEVRYFKD